jgi:hypothetical protein
MSKNGNENSRKGHDLSPSRAATLQPEYRFQNSLRAKNCVFQGGFLDLLFGQGELELGNTQIMAEITQLNEMQVLLLRQSN